MNELVKHIAVKAKLEHCVSHVRLQEFAELIAQECMGIALAELVPDAEIDQSDDIEDRCYLRGNNGGVVDAVVAIRNHFGIEA
jgi:hypothetical protein